MNARFDNVGSPKWVVVGGVALDTYTSSPSDPYKAYEHVRLYQANGTAVAAAGWGYVFAGGAPLAVQNWANVIQPCETARRQRQLVPTRRLCEGDQPAVGWMTTFG